MKRPTLRLNFLLRSLFKCALTVSLLFAHVSYGEAAEDTSIYKIGTAIGNVTPRTSELTTEAFFMGGYGFWKDRGAATGTHDLLTARAVCIENGETVCLAVVDSLGISGPLAQQIKQTAALRTGLPPSHILVSATHTHAAPDLLGLWGGSPEAYRSHLIDEVTGAIVSAYQGRVDSTIGFAAGTVKAHNRRDWGFTDDSLSLLVIRDPTNATLLAVIAFFAAHPVISPMENSEFSSDFVHYFREALTQQLKAPVIYFNGAIGDVNPHKDRSADYWSEAKAYGRLLAEESVMLVRESELAAVQKKVHGKIHGKVHGKVQLKNEAFSIPVTNNTLLVANLLGVVDGNISGPIWNRQALTSVNELRLGNSVSLVTIPGEAVTRLGLKIKEMMPAEMKLIIGQTDDSLGYIIPEDEWQTDRNGNYEESVSLGKEAATRMMAAIKKLLTPAGAQ